MSDSPNQVELGRPAAVHLLGVVRKLIEAIPRKATAGDLAVFSGQQGVMAAAASVNALLAIESRLGDLVAQQRIANVLAMLSKVSNLDLDWEAEQAAYEHLRGELAVLLKAAESSE
ncbi:hypothetical protein [Streptomyces sp. NPDC055990]|uniref:hypothetical protein n=1 Tax=Streptomyces sp. NPDC055990 TaxID=3345672 RepID=UPI0035D9A32A